MSTAQTQKPQAAKKDGDLLENVIDATNAALNREMAILRMENETIMTECRMHPRNMKEVRDKLSELLEEFPDFADDAMYSKPVGTDPETGQQKFARGLSIRAAEAMAEVYGYNRVRADVSVIDQFTVKIDATFTDFQSGRIWQDGGIVSKFYTSRNKQRVTHTDDRFYKVVVKAEKSKYIREVICRSVNSALKAWFESACQKVAETRLSDEDINKTLETWKRIGVLQEHLETAVGRTINMGWTNEDRLILRGLWTAIKDGETTLKDAFGIESAAKEKKQDKPSGPVATSDLTNPKQAESQPVELSLDEAIARYKDFLAAADSVTAARAVKAEWDKHADKYPDEMNEEAKALLDKREAELRGSRGGKKNTGTLLDTSPTAQTNGQ